AAGLSVLCVLARANVGLGTVMTSGVIAAVLILASMRPVRASVPGEASEQPNLAVGRLRWQGLFLASGIGVGLGTYILINWLKFGTILNGTPMEYYGQWVDNPHVARLIGSTLFQKDNLGLNIWAYLANSGLTTCADFPWLHMSSSPLILLGEHH